MVAIPCIVLSVSCLTKPWNQSEYLWFYINIRMLKSHLKLSSLQCWKTWYNLDNLDGNSIKTLNCHEKMFRFKPPSNSFLWDWILNAMTWRRQVQALQFEPVYRIKVKFLCFCMDLGYIGSFICMCNRISSGVT